MKWTEEPPTTPGLYWARLTADGTKEVVQVDHSFVGDLVVWPIGTDCCRSPCMWDLWYGPIEAPE